MKYVCTVCIYVYDSELGDPDYDIAPGTAFEALSNDFVCHICGMEKQEFQMQN